MKMQKKDGQIDSNEYKFEENKLLKSNEGLLF